MKFGISRKKRTESSAGFIAVVSGWDAVNFFSSCLSYWWPWQTRTYCCGHIVAHYVSWAGHKMNVVFPCCANWETFVADTKCFWTKSETFFCVPDTKFVSATNVARAGKRGNICIGNNVSSFVRAYKVVRATVNILLLFILIRGGAIVFIFYRFLLF